VRRREGDGEQPATEQSSLLRAFSMHDPIAELIAATPPEAIIRTCLYDRPPLEHLSVGRIALAGDAAHPMLPNLGQGAWQAIEDAVVLADELAATDDVLAALGRYSARRAQHTAVVVKPSRPMSRIAHPPHPARRRIPQRTPARQPTIDLTGPTRADPGTCAPAGADP
jgi:2-polyprenyl-6-methoxyphenol hydroxylase-like FAD-dependent oxidoreductase